MPINIFEDLDLRVNNPYSIGEIIQFTDSPSLLSREPLNYIKSPNDRYFTVVMGDSLSSISFQAYGDSKYWWVIYDVNNLLFPFDLTPGSTLVIPDLEDIFLLNGV